MIFKKGGIREKSVGNTALRDTITKHMYCICADLCVLVLNSLVISLALNAYIYPTFVITSH